MALRSKRFSPVEFERDDLEAGMAHDPGPDERGWRKLLKTGPNYAGHRLIGLGIVSGFASARDALAFQWSIDAIAKHACGSDGSPLACTGSLRSAEPERRDCQLTRCKVSSWRAYFR